MSEEANQLYHYTSMNALFHILNGIENGNLTLRATHYQYLNDTTECKLLNEYSKNSKYIASKRNKTMPIPDIYIISFSKNKDNLTMYRHYGSAKGIALKFNSVDFSIKKEYFLHKCEYINENFIFPNKISAFHSVASKFKIKYNNDSIRMFTYKHDSFEPEDEERLITIKDENTEVKFFEKNGLIKPYIEVQIPVTALKQIWLAPGCDEELSRKSILMLLESKGVTHISENDIIHSKHPYIDR